VSYRELLLGCGHKKEKRFALPGMALNWQNVTTVDMNKECDPDIWGTLDCYKWSGMIWRREPNVGAKHQWLPDTYDEVHAYEVLEHLGMQGDYNSFFQCFAMIWYVLKPNGYLFATTPSRFSPWLWGDPGHTRAILPQTLIFLDQTQYEAQKGKTSMSDYRFCYKADFKVVHSVDDRETHQFVLQAIKPARGI
jgi:hypothetical protein